MQCFRKFFDDFSISYLDGHFYNSKKFSKILGIFRSKGAFRSWSGHLVLIEPECSQLNNLKIARIEHIFYTLNELFHFFRISNFNMA